MPKFDEQPIEDFFNVQKDQSDMNDTNIGGYYKNEVEKHKD